MKAFSTLSLGILLACGAAAPVFAEDLYVIANSGLSIGAADIREIFLGEKQFAGSAKIIPVDNAAAQEAFLGKVMKMEAAKYGTAWTKKSFRDGLNPPAPKSGDAEVLNYVRSTPGAVGYVFAKPGGVNVVGKY